MGKMLRLGIDYQGIMGAAIGDYAGSTFEFSHFQKPKRKEDAKLFASGSHFTDDTVLTSAVAFFLETKGSLTIDQCLRQFALAYPNAGYGGRFTKWVEDESMKSYGSFGNGAAMRISPAAYFSSSEEEAIFLSNEITMSTHSHPLALKGAEVITTLIYRSLHGANKEELHTYASHYYDFESLDYREMCAFMGFGGASCETTVPQALWVFFHSGSFEDALRLALTIGWDSDTLCAIGSSLTEAFYKEIPEELLTPVKESLPKGYPCR